MRNLTIKRTKSFIACLAKLKVYIEDPASNEIKISGVPCKKLGDIKNGEEKIFQVEDTAAKVFVIADKLSKDYSSEFYQLPEGSEDLVLSGKNRFNPANGNAFRFDNNENEEVLTHRKRSNVKGSAVFVVSLLIGCIVGCVIGGAFGAYLFGQVLFGGNTDPKTFSAEGMSVTLTKEFKQCEYEPYTVAFDSKHLAVFATKEDFNLVAGFENYTLDQYLDLVIEANNITTQTTKKTDGLTYFICEAGDFRYFSFVYKAEDAFWLVQFAVRTEEADQYEARIIQWAKTVEFSS